MDKPHPCQAVAGTRLPLNMIKQSCVGTAYHQWSLFDVIAGEEMAYANWDRKVQELQMQTYSENKKYAKAMDQYKKDLEASMQYLQVNSTGVSMSPCYPTPCVAAKTAPVKKKAKNMYDCDEYGCGEPLNEAQQTKNHLIGRLDSVSSEKTDGLSKAYGLRDDERPKTPREFLDRITNGKFVVAEDNMNKKIYYFEDAVRWRDPAIKRDEEGFALASKKLEDARTDATDEIMVKTPEQGLDVLKAFKAATFN